MQAELDTMSGVLHTEEGDYITAGSYFLESYEGFDLLGSRPDASVKCLKCVRVVLACEDVSGDVI